MRPLRPADPRAASLSLAALGALGGCALLGALLRSGGLAPVAIAAVVAVFVGAPIARAQWLRGDADPVRLALADLARAAWGTAAVAALAEPWRGAPGSGAATAFATALGAPFAGAVLLRFGWGRAAAVAALGLAGVAACWPAVTVDATAATVPAPPWDLLSPQFAAWRDWWSPAVVAGLALAGAGVGGWSSTARPPGDRRTPWAAVGLGLAVALVAAVRAGTLFAASLGTPPADPLALALGAAALGLAGPQLARRPLLLAGGAVWVWGPAADALPFVVTVLAPGLSVLVLLHDARTARGVGRGPGLLGAALLVPAIAAGARWPGDAPAAVAVGALVVAVFWAVATRLTLAAREAA